MGEFRARSSPLYLFYPPLRARVLVLRMFGAELHECGLRYQRGIVLLWLWFVVELLAVTSIVTVFMGDELLVVAAHIVTYAYIAMATLVCIISSHYLTNGFRRLVVDLDPVLSRRGRRFTRGWLTSSHSLTKQFAAAISVALILLAALLPTLWKVGSPSGVAYAIAGGVTVFYCAFVLGACLYWLGQGTYYMYRITRVGMLRLYSPAPGRTPGIEVFSGLLGKGFVIAAFTSLVFLLPVMLGVIPIDVPTQIGARNRALRLALLAAAGAVTVALGIAPQLFLSQAVGRARRQRMNVNFRTQLSASDPAELAALRSDFEKLADSPPSTISLDTAVQIAVAVGALFTPFCISLIVG